MSQYLRYLELFKMAYYFDTLKTLTVSNND